MKVYLDHSNITQNMHGASRNYRYVWDVSPTLFKDARNYVLSCDKCQRVGYISRRNEMPMNYSLVIEPFDC